MRINEVWFVELLLIIFLTFTVSRMYREYSVEDITFHNGQRGVLNNQEKRRVKRSVHANKLMALRELIDTFNKGTLLGCLSESFHVDGIWHRLECLYS